MKAKAEPLNFHERLKKFWIWLITPPRPIKIQRSGWIYLFIVVGVGFGAIASGNNLLFIIFGGLLSIIIISGILSDLSLRKVKVYWTIPEVISAGEDFPFNVKVMNNKRWFPSVDVEVDLKGKHISSDPAILPFIERRSAVWGSGRFRVPERGIYRVDAVRAFTYFPFGFFEKMMYVRAGDVIYAGPKPLRCEIPDVILKSGGLSGLPVKSSEGDDLLNIRQFMPGDSPKLIHWKVTAKKGTRMVRVMGEPPGPECYLKPLWRGRKGGELERTLGRAIYLAEVLLKKGWKVGLILGGKVIGPISHTGDLYQFRKEMASFDPDGRFQEPHVEGFILEV